MGQSASLPQGLGHGSLPACWLPFRVSGVPEWLFHFQTNWKAVPTAFRAGRNISSSRLTDRGST